MNHFKGLSKSKDDAVWQYLIDHCKPQKYGYKIQFFLRNRGEWDGKVRYRMEGNYRNDDRKLEVKLQKQCEEYEVLRKNAAKAEKLKLTINFGNSITNRKQKKFEKKANSKNPIDRIMLGVYKFARDYIYE